VRGEVLRANDYLTFLRFHPAGENQHQGRKQASESFQKLGQVISICQNVDIRQDCVTIQVS
jgi:hypothetical protein